MRPTPTQAYVPGDQPPQLPLEQSLRRVWPQVAARRTHGWAASRAPRLCAVASVFAVLIATAAPSAFASAAGQTGFEAKRKPISAASAFVLPSTAQCVSGRQLTIQLHKLPHVRWIDATVKVNGRRVLTIAHSRIDAAVKLTGLPTGAFVLSITAKTSDGRSVTATRTYRSCVPAPKKVTPVTPVTPITPITPVTPITPEEPIKQQPSSSSAQEGFYDVGNPQGDAQTQVEFYVSPEGNLQDVSTGTYMTCVPSRNSFDDHIEFSEIAVAANGSFTASTELEKIFEGQHAKVKYEFSGHVAETSVSGSYREELTYTNGSKYECSSNEQHWTATRESGQQPLSLPAEEGFYTVGSPQGDAQTPVEFYVSPTGNLQDVSAGTYMMCTPARNAVQDHIEFSEIAVAANGSFAASTELEKVFEGEHAKVKYEFSGHVHGANSYDQPRIVGSYRETLTYTNGSKYECSSNFTYSSSTSENPVHWTATRESGQQPLSLPAEEGRYSIGNPQGDAQAEVEFYVSPKGNLQDVSTGAYLMCTPSRSGFKDHMEFSEIPVAADGSFAASTELEKVFEGEHAKVKYEFSGHVHGANSYDQPRIVGSYHEELIYTDGSKYECSSNFTYSSSAAENPVHWTATRESGQQPLSLPAEEGLYSVENPQGDAQAPVEFHISPEGNLQDVSTGTYMMCTPSRSDFKDDIEFSEIPVAADGSFAASRELEKTFEDQHAKVKYEFSGHVQGATSNGVARIVGSYREELVYTNGSTYECSSNGWYWTATRK
jgi:hypothetical protein